MVAIDLAVALNRDLPGMSVWTPSVGAALEDALRKKLPTAVVPYMRILSNGYASRAQAFFQTWRALAITKPTLIHSHSPYAYRSVSFFKRLLRFRAIAHIQIETDPTTLAWCFKIPPDRVVACAEFLVPSIQNALQSIGARQTSIEVCPNSVDVDRFVAGDRIRTRQVLGMKPDSLIILMLANLSPHKGQETIIEAVRILRESGLPAEAYIAGVDRDRTNYEEILRELARRAGVASSIHLLGFRNDTPQLLQAADFFVLPSTHEGLPLSILEAQSARIPVLAAPTAGVPEIIEHQRTGYLIPANDARGYAMAIARLSSSPTESQSIVDRAQQRVVEQYSRSAYLRKISSLYQGLIGRG